MTELEEVPNKQVSCCTKQHIRWHRIMYFACCSDTRHEMSMIGILWKACFLRRQAACRGRLVCLSNHLIPNSTIKSTYCHDRDTIVT